MEEASRPGLSTTLRLRPGLPYRVSLGILAFFAALTPWLSVVPGRPQDEPNRPWFVGGSAAIAFLALASTIYYRLPRTLELDASGIRLRRGGGRARALGWGEVRWVRHGTKLVTLSALYIHAVRVTYFLHVQGTGYLRRIYVDEVDYRVSREALVEMAATVSELASRRDIPVKWTQVGEAGTSRLTRILGSHANTPAIGMALLSGWPMALGLGLILFQGSSLDLEGWVTATGLAGFFGIPFSFSVYWIITRRRFPCPRCGVQRVFAPVGRSWRCVFCKGIFTPTEISGGT